MLTIQDKIDIVDHVWRYLNRGRTVVCCRDDFNQEAHLWVEDAVRRPNLRSRCSGVEATKRRRQKLRGYVWQTVYRRMGRWLWQQGSMLSGATKHRDRVPGVLHDAPVSTDDDSGTRTLLELCGARAALDSREPPPVECAEWGERVRGELLRLARDNSIPVALCTKLLRAEAEGERGKLPSTMKRQATTFRKLVRGSDVLRDLLAQATTS